MKQILIIEDDQILREMYKDKMEGSGFSVRTAVDGEEGLAMALQNHPDLILLDVLMPKLDGIKVMESLREDAWGKNTPIIILTNLNVDGELLNKIITDRPTYCMMKIGVTPEEVMQKAKNILSPQPESN